MANSDKNIVITPNKGSSTDNPKIAFTGADSSSSNTITARMYNTSNGTLSFEGSAGQLFAVTNDLSDTIFSVNDISGIPAISVDASGVITFAQYGGTIVLGNQVSANGGVGSAGQVLMSRGAGYSPEWSNAGVNIDGGMFDSNYGGITSIDGGGIT